MMWRVTTLSACLVSTASAQLTSGVNGNEAKQPIFLTPDPTPMPTGVPPAPTPAPTQPVDCQGEWSEFGAATTFGGPFVPGACWPPCSEGGGEGKQYQYFFVTKQAVGWGMPCPTSNWRDFAMGKKTMTPPNKWPLPTGYSGTPIPMRRACDTKCETKDATKYFIKKMDTCQVYASSIEECAAAALSLKMHGDGRTHLDDYTPTAAIPGMTAPPHCYWQGGELMYNADAKSTVECSNKYKCICKMDGCRAHDNIKFKTVNKKDRKDKFCNEKCNNMKKCRKFRPDCTKCNEQCACTASIEIDKRLKKKRSKGNRRREGGKFENGPVRLV